jgi:hypothetical protein
VAATDKPVPKTGVVEGEMFGAPVPGWWPGSKLPEGKASPDESEAVQESEPTKGKRRRLRRRKPQADR